MARRKKKSGGGGGGAGWIVTFSDLMTLLLTFFVLLLSMSSMDAAKLSRISAFDSSWSILAMGSQTKVSERIKMLTEMLRDEEKILLEQDRIKDLLFPDDVLPPEMLRSTLNENLSVLQHPEGVVIVLTGDLLFPEGSAELDAKGKALLGALTPVIQSVNSDVNISGYTDNTPSRVMSNDDLSALRALSALEYFLHDGLQPQRFSVSGYGADRPLFSNSTADGRAKNRRVEILLKTTNRFAGY